MSPEHNRAMEVSRPLIAIYNRVSVEHDLDLDVAKALLLAVVGGLPLIGRDANRAELVIAMFSGPFMILAQPLGIPPTRMAAAIEMTVTEYLQVASNQMKAAKTRGEGS